VTEADGSSRCTSAAAVWTGCRPRPASSSSVAADPARPQRPGRLGRRVHQPDRPGL